MTSNQVKFIYVVRGTAVLAIDRKDVRGVGAIKGHELWYSTL